MKQQEKLLIQFGAGNIGRSFVGQIFARNGWEVVFVDVDAELLKRLNSDRSYDVVVKDPDGSEERITVAGVRGVDATDSKAVARELERTAYVGSAVGSSAISHVIPLLAAECARRHREEPGRLPFDVILAENIHDGASLVQGLIRSALPQDLPPSALPGVVECSVGKMVPLLTEEAKQKEPTTVFAERYNTLILDSRAWKNPIPPIPELAPVDNIAAYVDRKLFIHNLGHAAVAYLGHPRHPEATYLYELLEDEEVSQGARRAMECSAEALVKAYPESFTREQLRDHIDNLLYRFRNRALGDTVHRVGRDLQRKLSGEDRVVGAIRLAHRHGVDPEPIVEVYRKALRFRAPDEKGALFPGDEEFHETLLREGPGYLLKEISGLREGEALFDYLNRRVG
mgnify:CR=1 FL=1